MSNALYDYDARNRDRGTLRFRTGTVLTPAGLGIKLKSCKLQDGDHAAMDAAYGRLLAWLKAGSPAVMVLGLEAFNAPGLTPEPSRVNADAAIPNAAPDTAGAGEAENADAVAWEKELAAQRVRDARRRGSRLFLPPPR